MRDITLLNIDSNAKTVKGQARGFMTAILYLAPFKAAGLNVCPMAELAGCIAGCLNTAGHGGMAKAGATFAPFGLELPDNGVQKARINRTRFYAEDRDGFMAQLCGEIRKFLKRAARKGLTPVVRLNGTSDIRWELIPAEGLENVFAVFPDVQFYDYTKIPNRKVDGIANYHLSISYSEASARYAAIARESATRDGRNLVAVFRGELPATFLGRPVINGDESDLRFLDPQGVVVGLKAKGAAKRDTSGFVIDPCHTAAIAA
jgi:hypothetical protein